MGITLTSAREISICLNSEDGGLMPGHLMHCTTSHAASQIPTYQQACLARPALSSFSLLTCARGSACQWSAHPWGPRKSPPSRGQGDQLTAGVSRGKHLSWEGPGLRKLPCLFIFCTIRAVTACEDLSHNRSVRGC